MVKVEGLSKTLTTLACAPALPYNEFTYGSNDRIPIIYLINHEYKPQSGRCIIYMSYSKLIKVNMR
jgi:hypothetical protein